MAATHVGGFQKYRSLFFKISMINMSSRINNYYHLLCAMALSASHVSYFEFSK